MTGRYTFREQSVTGKAGGTDVGEELTGGKVEGVVGRGEGWEAEKRVGHSKVVQHVEAKRLKPFRWLTRALRRAPFILRWPDGKVSMLSRIRAYLCGSTCSLL